MGKKKKLGGLKMKKPLFSSTYKPGQPKGIPQSFGPPPFFPP